ncbi:MAG: hypothetical protein Q9169_002118 [Polycauliona sp. 2 TL-2023]
MSIESGTDVFHMDLAEALPNIDYVAISHVWADGLGNPNANSLPMCRLRRLHSLVASLCGQIQSEDTFIWLDTLCCPIAPPEAKILALRQMVRPYTDASQVLVLDSSLRDVESSQLHPTEIWLRALTSGWMSRLWTLQEGALARNLWFQFSDTAVNLERVVGNYTFDLARRGLIKDAMYVYTSMRCFCDSETPAVQNAIFSRGLDAIDYALRHRAVTVATDEPLLIGELLKLDVAFILDGPESSRMQRLWSLMPSINRGIPQDILFRGTPRLSEPGFRWAPATLRNTEFSINDCETGILTTSGLCVQLAALPIAILPTLPGLMKVSQQPTGQGPPESIYCRSGNGTWVVVSPPSLQHAGQPTLRTLLQDISTQRMLLLASPFKFDGSPEQSKALLVQCSNDRSRIPEVSSEMLVLIRTRVGDLCVLLESAYEASQELLTDKITDQFLSLGVEDAQEQKDHPGYPPVIASLLKKLRFMGEHIEDRTVQEAMQSMKRYGDSKQFYLESITNAYTGRFGVVGPVMPENSLWCVD